ncbi:MAG: SufD family Fe-S cluster assembly protein [Clostridia bacterium]|nr:SufD family Fe-S cluster assembly protein [Clostridia bacterium]MBO5433412.1 SufD family Fe-S cluster assembly protein [Clostridia bacterium]MBP3559244.1 SufD family Fe-S cluster assembly protein [Clostridia bacterium]
MNNTELNMLKEIADLHEIPQGAFSLRKDGESVERRSSENIIIEPKKDKPGIDITVKPGTKNESVHMPVIITKTGVEDLVYNDFYIGEDADVLIVAGCGIHNSGDKKSEHDGIHRFHIGKNARLKYVEKHYGEGEGTGERILNPTTEVYMDENSFCEMETVQIRGVDSTKRDTVAKLQSGARLVVLEKLMTHGKQIAHSNMIIELNGEDASSQIISRSVAKDKSEQVFYPRAIGNARCKAHVQCDSIIMDDAHIRSIPEIAANHCEANIIHEAAIGRINNDQLLKLQTLGKSEEEAEEIIINCFLK